MNTSTNSQSDLHQHAYYTRLDSSEIRSSDILEEELDLKSMHSTIQNFTYDDMNSEIHDTRESDHKTMIQPMIL